MPSFDAWSLFFLVAASHGVLLSILLFLRRSATNHLLGWLVLSFSLCIGFYITFWTGYYQSLPSQLGVLQGLTLTFGPLTLSYLQSDKKQTRFDLRHLLPWGLFSVYYLFFPRPDIIPSYILAGTQILHLIAYCGLIFRWISKNRGFTNGVLKRYKWHRKIGLSFLGYTLSFVLYYALVFSRLLKPEWDYMISLASSFFIYFIGYHGFQKQEVLKMNESPRYEKSGLDKSSSKAIHQKLKALMESEQSYLNHELKLGDIAKALDIQTHHISQAINEIEAHNFSDFVNEYRVKHAVELLLQTDHKILRVAIESGFNNKASFNNAFKKITGIPPSHYREENRIVA